MSLRTGLTKPQSRHLIQRLIGLLGGEGLEEGEIQRAQENSLPSLEFQEALKSTQATGDQVITDPADEVKGLKVVTSMVNNSVFNKEDDMDMGEIRACLLEKGIDMDSEDFLKEIPEENIDELLQEYDAEAMVEDRGMEEAEVVVDSVAHKEGEEVKDGTGGGQEKPKGARRRILKYPQSTLRSNKLRAAAAVLLSPHNRPMAKGARQEEGHKMKDGKGSSFPPVTHKK